MNLIDNLNWRYATKKMTGEPISQEALNNILEVTRLSASSYGLQPYNIILKRRRAKDSIYSFVE